MIDTLRRRDQQYRLLAEQAADGVLLVARRRTHRGREPRRRRAARAPARRSSLKLPLARPRRGRQGGRQRGRAAGRCASGSGSPAPTACAARRARRSTSRSAPGACADGRLQLALRDIAERRRAADALRESEDRYERLAASAPDAIVIEASGRVVLANPSLRQHAGAAALGAAWPAARSATSSTPTSGWRWPRRRPAPRRPAPRACGSRRGCAAPTARPPRWRARRRSSPTAAGPRCSSCCARCATTGRPRRATSTATRSPASRAPSSHPTGSRSRSRRPTATARAWASCTSTSTTSRRSTRGSAGRSPTALLRAVARRLLHCVRQGDTAARLEQDSFALVLPGLHHAEDATRIGEKVLRALRKPFPLTEGATSLTASVGIAVFPEDGEDAPALLASAERSAARAHAAGGDRIESSTPPPPDDSWDAVELEAGLRAALASRQHVAQRPPAARGRPALPADLRRRRRASSASRRCCAGSTPSWGSCSRSTSSPRPTSRA